MPSGARAAEFGPPQCSTDPHWTTVNVDSYNSKLMVSVGPSHNSATSISPT